MKNPTNPNLNPDKGTNKAQTSCRIQELSKGAVLVAWLKVCETHRGIGRGYLHESPASLPRTDVSRANQAMFQSFIFLGL